MPTNLKSVAKVTLKFAYPLKGPGMSDVAAAHTVISEGVAALAKHLGLEPDAINVDARPVRVRDEPEAEADPLAIPAHLKRA